MASDRRRIEDLERRTTVLEQKVGDLGEHIARSLDALGQYKQRSRDELALIHDQLDQQVIPTLLNLVDHAKATDAERRAADLLKRARNHRTRAKNALGV